MGIRYLPNAHDLIKPHRTIFEVKIIKEFQKNNAKRTP